MATSKDRILDFISHLGIGQTKFEENAGISRGYLSKIKSSIGSGTLKKIMTAYPELNQNWLITGDGDMLLSKKEIKEVEHIIPEHIIYVPLVNQYAYGGYLCGYADTEYIESLPTIPFIVDQEAHGHYVAFEVKGDSMDDGTDESYKEGDRLLCREIDQRYWTDSKLHIRKWDFVIVHEEGILIKRIVKHDVDNKTITIHSLNPYYPDRILNLSEVKQIFNVIEMMRPRRR